ncbi:MAG: hypothetical protein NC131_20855 [Roseburia sp.]|nr:hypothetical protein [Roseburia sp.]
MVHEDGQSRKENKDIMEKFTVQLTDAMMYDRLHILSAEYSISVEALINIAVKRLASDIDFVRNLRIGNIKIE